jgi:hypothetical protein
LTKRFFFYFSLMRNGVFVLFLLSKFQLVLLQLDRIQVQLNFVLGLNNIDMVVVEV